MWMVLATVTSATLVVWGRYRKVELAATLIASVLAAASVAAAIAVRPEASDLLSGLVPQIPDAVQYEEILPWLGFMLSGAAGLIWYSYWITEKGYGAASLARRSHSPIRPQDLGRDDQQRLRGWVTQMTFDCSIAVLGTLIVTVAFLILGTELLLPRNLVPEEDRVAQTLGRLLGDVWGPIGFWFMVTAVFIGFWDTVLSDQDGHGRLFANGARLLARGLGIKGAWQSEDRLQKVFVTSLATVLPIVLYLIVGEPVGLLKIAGAIEAAHIPVVAVLVLLLNHRMLPATLRPSRFTVIATAAAAAFFAVFALLYLLGFR
jgi:Mn2+/Fe2+ NRAMP family transporter